MINDWERTYSVKGTVQHGVLDTVLEACELLKRRKCKSVVDLCCGTGRHTLYLARNGFRVIGIDEAKSAIEICKEKIDCEGLTNVSVRVADMKDTKLEDNSFDALLCVWSIGHGFFDDIARTVNEMFKVIKPGGLLLADFPSERDHNCGVGMEIAPKTYLHPFLDHSDIPHCYCSEAEVEALLRPHARLFRIKEIDYNDPKYNSVIKAYWVVAEKA